MKLWNVLLMKRQRGERRQSGDSKNKSICGTPNTAATSGSIGVKKRLGFSSWDDTASESTVGNDAPWRIENIIDGPFKEDDWWQDVAVEVEDNNSKKRYDSSIDDEDDDELDNNNDGRLSATAVVLEKTFVNRGAETFVQVQKAWRECGNRNKVARNNTKGTLVMSSLRKELSKRLPNSRQCEFPKKIPLKDLISVYVQEWYGDDTL